MENDIDDIEDENVDIDDTPEPQAEDLKGLRRAAKEGSKAKGELAAARRELAMLKAGVDVESPVGKLFAKAYDGDSTPEAIKAEWATISPIPNETTPIVTDLPDPEIDADEAASTAQRSALAANSPADIPSTKSGRDLANEGADAIYAKGGSRDTALASVFEALTGAAAAGDGSVIVKGFE